MGSDLELSIRVSLFLFDFDLLVWMAVESRWLTVSSPSGVCNSAVGFEGLGHVDTRVVDEFSELDNLAHLFECEDLISLVSVNCQTGRIVTSVFETG